VTVFYRGPSVLISGGPFALKRRFETLLPSAAVASAPPGVLVTACPLQLRGPNRIGHVPVVRPMRVALACT
jgi:hypothetical protein